MKFRVRYCHQPTGEIARTYWMTRPDAVETARQYVRDGEAGAEIEDEDGQVTAIDKLAE